MGDHFRRHSVFVVCEILEVAWRIIEALMVGFTQRRLVNSSPKDAQLQFKNRKIFENAQGTRYAGSNFRNSALLFPVSANNDIEYS